MTPVPSNNLLISLVHSFNQYLSSLCQVPAALTGAVNTVTQKREGLCSLGVHIIDRGEGWQVNKYINTEPSHSDRCFEECLNTFEWWLREQTKLSLGLCKSLYFSQQNIKWNLYNAIQLVLPPEIGDPGSKVNASYYQEEWVLMPKHHAHWRCAISSDNPLQDILGYLHLPSGGPPPRGYG